MEKTAAETLVELFTDPAFWVGTFFMGIVTNVLSSLLLDWVRARWPHEPAVRQEERRLEEKLHDVKIEGLTRGGKVSFGGRLRVLGRRIVGLWLLFPAAFFSFVALPIAESANTPVPAGLRLVAMSLAVLCLYLAFRQFRGANRLQYELEVAARHHV
jgi:hypothetical protein